MNRAERIEHVVMGVVRQAMRDAGTSHVTIDGDGPDAALLRRWCQAAFGDDVVSKDGLRLHPANKTAVLLGDVPDADVLPFGDLYASQLAELTGVGEQSDAVEKALRQFYDQRADWESAVAHLAPDVRAHLRDTLETSRFRRTRAGLVPKLGPRTIGIDLWT
jgi:hypothetical protein